LFIYNAAIWNIGWFPQEVKKLQNRQLFGMDGVAGKTTVG